MNWPKISIVTPSYNQGKYEQHLAYWDYTADDAEADSALLDRLAP